MTHVKPAIPFASTVSQVEPSEKDLLQQVLRNQRAILAWVWVQYGGSAVSAAINQTDHLLNGSTHDAPR